MTKKSTVDHLKDALIAIAKSGECDVSQKMSYGTVPVQTSEGVKLATITLTLKKPPKLKGTK